MNYTDSTEQTEACLIPQAIWQPNSAVRLLRGFEKAKVGDSGASEEYWLVAPSFSPVWSTHMPEAKHMYRGSEIVIRSNGTPKEVVIDGSSIPFKKNEGEEEFSSLHTPFVKHRPFLTWQRPWSITASVRPSAPD